MRFTDLRVWQKSIELVGEVYRLTANFPRAEQFGITSQLRRAAVSISANIAEGHGRATRGEFLNQLSVANGSANEVTTLLIVSDMLGFASTAELQEIRRTLEQVQRMIVRMRSSLKNA